MILKVFVACVGMEGPDFYFCNVDCEKNEYDDGEHYEVAKTAASLQGYEEPMVAFDEKDAAGKAMLDKFNWETATTFSSSDF